MDVKPILIVAACAIIIPAWPAFTFDTGKSLNASSSVRETKFPVPNHQTTGFKSDELIGQQSENIRHIIATEPRERQIKKEKAIAAIEDDRFPTLEELRAKCQHYSRLFGLNQYGGGNSAEHHATSDVNDRQSTTIPHLSDYHNRPIIEATRRPVFIRNKPTFIQKNNGGFYVTAPPTGNEISTTKKVHWSIGTTPYPRAAHASSEHSASTTPTTTSRMTTTFYVSNPKVKNITDGVGTTARPKIKIKYTKFEPVILQKTILTDGRVMYHWHRSLPTAAVDLPAPIAPIVTPIMQPPTYEYSHVPATMPLSQRNLGPAETSTAESAKSTTTEKSSWLFVPFSSLFGGSYEEETTTVENNITTPLTTSTTTKPDMEYVRSSTEDAKLAQQLKLVVPVHYDDLDSNLASQSNRLAYYRRVAEAANGVQPSSLQLVKTLGIPQSVPRYSLGYAGTGYGLTHTDGIPLGRPYGPGYVNYQAYSGAALEREDKRLDDVSV